MKFLVLTALVGLSACAGLEGYRAGTEVTPAQIQQFHTGTTTRQEVLAALGAPQEQREIGGDLHFQYNYQEINHIGPGRNETTVFVFDKKGVLKEIQQGQGQATNPLQS